MTMNLNPQSAQAFVNYYSSLLILEYLNKVKASATIAISVSPALMPQTTLQAITFAIAPTSGTFVIKYGSLSTAAINWNDSIATIQTKIQAVTGLGSVTVTGSIAGQSLMFTMTGIAPPATPFTIINNSLTNGATQIIPFVTISDVTLPFAVMNGFNINPALGPVAVGTQLDILGKYAGVTRNGNGFFQPIILDDADFLRLIQMAIIRNNAGSSLATIQSLLNQFFPGEILVFDYANMQMSYLISSTVGSQALVQLFVTELSLPKPMGVQLATVIYAPIINAFFGFRTYSLPAFNSSPFNDYASYQTNWPWLSYQDAIFGGATVVGSLLTEDDNILDTEDGQGLGLG